MGSTEMHPSHKLYRLRQNTLFSQKNGIFLQKAQKVPNFLRHFLNDR